MLAAWSGGWVDAQGLKRQSKLNGRTYQHAAGHRFAQRHLVPNLVRRNHACLYLCEQNVRVSMVTSA